MTIGVRFVGGGCNCANANNHRSQTNERTGSHLPMMGCLHTHSMASALRAAKKKGKKRTKKAGG